MSKIKFFMMQLFILSSFPMVAYAEERRMDKAMMTALCQLMQISSGLFLMIAIGMYILAFKGDQPDFKGKANKMMLVFLVTFLMLPLMKMAGFAY